MKLSRRDFIHIACAAAVATLVSSYAKAGINNPGTASSGSTPIAAMGANLNTVVNFNTENPFLNILKTGGGWQTSNSGGSDTGEEVYFYANMVDSNHFTKTLSATGTAVGGTGGVSSTTLTVASVSAALWVGGTISGTGISGTPTITACPAGGCGVAGAYTMSAAQTISNGVTITENPTFTKVGFGVLFGGWAYPTGNYVFLCNGNSTFVASGDVSQTITCNGAGSRTIITIASPGSGVIFNQTAVTPATYTSSAALVYSPDSTSGHVGTNEAAYNAGTVLNPAFVSVTKLTNRSIRFMDWNITNHNTVQQWSDRTQSSWVFWDELAINIDVAAPLETEITVCNQVGAEYCWFAIPCAASDDYVVHMADLTHTTLNPGIKIVVESCNEIWNQAYSTALATILANYGAAIFSGVSDVFSQRFSFNNMRTVQIARTFKKEWGTDSSRVYPVQGGQIGFTDRNQFLLQDSPFWAGAPFGNLTGTISGCPSACVLTASGITGTATLQAFSRISGSGLTTDACWITTLGTSTGGNGTANLGGSGCANVGSESMTAQMWGSAPGAIGNVSFSNSTMTVNSTASGSFAVGQYLWIVGTAQASNLPHGVHIVSGTGPTFTLNTSLSSTFPSNYNVVAAAPADIDAANVSALATAPYFNTDPPLAVTADSDGGVARMLSQATSGTLLPVSAGAPTTGGTTTAYTLTSGHSFASAPANGTCISVQFNANNTGTATIAVDSIGALPLFDYIGGAITAGNTLASGQWAGGLLNVLCYTNATGAGSVTAGWYTNAGSFGASGGDVQQAINFWSADQTTAQSFSISLFGYEGGQQYVDATGNTFLRSLITAMNRATGMGTAYTQWMTGLKGVVSGTPITHYNDIGIYGAGNAFGSMEAVNEGGSPKYNALTSFTTH